jgi:hypothetical protein
VIFVLLIDIVFSSFSVDCSRQSSQQSAEQSSRMRAPPQSRVCVSAHFLLHRNTRLI